MLRLGSSLVVSHKLASYVFDSQACEKATQFDTTSGISKLIADKLIFAVTSTSATKHTLLVSSKLSFDYCVVDEAGQLTEPEVLGPISKCKKFVLVGDNHQLPPLVQSNEAKKKGMNISLFERLADKFAIIAAKSLTIQYRMNQDILSLSNTLVYHQQMRCASEIIANKKIRLNGNNNDQTCWSSLAEWVKPVIDPDRGVILINTDKLYEKDIKNQKLGNKMNQHHANLINCIVSDLLHCGIHSSQIGIIAPYHSQLKLIKNKLTKTQENCLLIETIDRVQEVIEILLLLV